MTSADQVLAQMRAYAPQIAARAREIEEARTLPPDIVAELRRIGLFRLLTPKSHGGLEMEFPKALEVMSAVSAADGSAGWAAMIGSSSGLLYSRLTRETFDEIYSKSPDIIQAGLVHSVGTAEKVDGGYRVTGRWPFASGAPHADWIMGGVKIFQDSKPLPGLVEGSTRERLITLPAREWTIEDTWKVGGLKGSGSNHVSLKDVFVPEAYCFDIAGPSCVEGPFYATVGAWIPFFHAAFAVGLAEGAFADIQALAGTGKQQYRTRAPMREQPVFQYELGRAQADLRAAQAYLKTTVNSHWQRALAGTLTDPLVFFDGIQMNVWVTQACVRVIDMCYTLGGGSSLYDESPLQRRLRDIHTATQHVATAYRHYLGAGALAVGLPPASFF